MRITFGRAGRVLFRRDLPPETWGGQVYRLRATGQELLRLDASLPNPPGKLVIIEGRRYTVHATEVGGATVLLERATRMGRSAMPVGGAGEAR
jgi:hypothetical protein